jgi:hypothetical protein
LADYLGDWSARYPLREWLVAAGAGFAAGGGLLFLLPRLPAIHYLVAAFFMPFWFIGMQAQSASDTGRFLLPLSLAAACLSMPLAGVRRSLLCVLVLILIICAPAYLLVYTRAVDPVLLAAFALALVCAAFERVHKAAYLIAIIVVVGYSAAKILTKFDVGRDVGYGYWKQDIDILEEASQSGLLITDFYILPHRIRVRDSVMLYASQAYGPKFVRMVKSRAFDCSGRPLMLFGTTEFMDEMSKVRLKHCPTVTRVDRPRRRWMRLP